MTDQQALFLLSLIRRKLPKWLDEEGRKDVSQELCLLVLKGADLQDPSTLREALDRNTRRGPLTFPLRIRGQYDPNLTRWVDIPIEEGEEFSSTLGWALACVVPFAEKLDLPEWASISRNGRINWKCEKCGKGGSVADNKHHLKLSLRAHSLRCLKMKAQGVKKVA